MKYLIIVLGSCNVKLDKKNLLHCYVILLQVAVPIAYEVCEDIPQEHCVDVPQKVPRKICKEYQTPGYASLS